MPSVDDLANTPAPPTAEAVLTWVYPAAGHTTWEDRTFVLGSFTFPRRARSGAVMLTHTVPGRSTSKPLELPVDVSSKDQRAFFAHPINLYPGSNHIMLTLLIDDQEVQYETRTIECPTSPDLATLWSEPITEPYRWAWPTQAITLMDKTRVHSQGLQVGFWGPPGLTEPTAHLQLNARRFSLALTPMALTDDTAQSQFAQRHQLKAPLPREGVWYGATLSTHEWPEYRDSMGVNITYKAGYQGHTRTLTPMANLTLETPDNGLPWFTLTEATTAKRGGLTGVPLTPRWLPNTRVQGVLKQDGWIAVSALPSCQQPRWQQASDWVWVSESVLQASSETGWVLDNSMSPRYPAITQLHASVPEPGQRTGWVRLAIPLPFAVPVSWHAAETHLTITFSGVSLMNEWVVLADDVRALGVNAMTWLSNTMPDQATLQVDLSRPLWGAKVFYDDLTRELVVLCRTTLGLRQALETRPFRLVLDPGHGGDEMGTTALEGTAEKDLNLAIAQACVNEQVPVIDVILTRLDDVTLSLSDRVALCESFEPDLVLSLHHNALPDGRDPQAEHGWSTFYWHDLAQPIAQTFQARAMAILQHAFADYGVTQTDFTMTRLSVAPSLLLECGFLTHPANANLCVDPSHPERVARMILATVQSLRSTIRSTP